MRLLGMALALSTLCLTGCANRAPLRALPVTPDEAPLDSCPATFPVAPVLPPLAPIALPDGRRAVLLDNVIARETPVAHYIVQGRGAWFECRSAVIYVKDWSARLRANAPVLK